MPREGIFVKVLQSGKVKTGDEISVCEDETAEKHKGISLHQDWNQYYKNLRRSSTIIENAVNDKHYKWNMSQLMCSICLHRE